ncbi:MAG TPA: 1-acyl-sn-glycerol-3-phosphate acyltransferase, partial [Bdellovibrio sp.]|nr:1-acyl-sn-glycerol-3-phosphate acyltransferase [Bdellovibrio sp.]
MKNSKKMSLLHFLFASILVASTMLNTSALAAEKCEWVFDKPALLELKMGVRQTENADKPLGLQIVQSRNPNLSATINAVATWAFGKILKLDAINQVTKRYLADESADTYFVKLARAFDLKYVVDENAIQKNVPAKGPAIVVLNHPRNGSDGLAVAAAISKIRPDVKIAMTLFLENVPGMSENAIFLDPYGGPKARAYNAGRMIEMQNHLEQGGLIVIFASGEVSSKDPDSS